MGRAGSGQIRTYEIKRNQDGSASAIAYDARGRVVNAINTDRPNPDRPWDENTMSEVRRAARKHWPGARERGIRKALAVTRVHLDRGGYTKHGQYFGIGAPLYYVGDEETNKGQYVRASSAAEARERAVSNPRGWQ